MMKQTINKIKNSPIKQFLIVLLLVAGYWIWELHSYDHAKEYYVSDYQIELPDTVDVPRPTPEAMVIPDTLSEGEKEVDDILPEVEYRIMEDDSDVYVQMEMRLQFWDMVLGHIASILGSLVVLLTPLITYFLNRKKQNKDSEESN